MDINISDLKHLKIQHIILQKHTMIQIMLDNKI